VDEKFYSESLCSFQSHPMGGKEGQSNEVREALARYFIPPWWMT
jgi:hypothetical protein